MMQTVAVPQMPYNGKRKMIHNDNVMVNPIVVTAERPTKRICAHSTSLRAVDVLANTISVIKTTGQLARMNTNSVRVYLKDKLRPAIDEIEHILPDTGGKLEEDLNDALTQAWECEKFSVIHIAEETPVPVVATVVESITDVTDCPDDASDTEQDYYEVDVNFDDLCGDLDPFDVDEIADAISEYIENETGMEVKPILVTVTLPDWLHIDIWNDMLRELITRYTEVEIDHFSSSDDCSVFTIVCM